MSFIINDKSITEKLANHLERSRKEQVDSLEKLSTGTVFTAHDPRPSERAIAEGLSNRMRSLTASKKNINDAISLLQTAESSFSVINDIVTRMKEINIAATNSTMDAQEQRYLFIEYQALYDEVNRIALATEYNGIPLLNGADESVPETVSFRIDDPFKPSEGSGIDLGDVDDINVINFKGIKNVVATAEGLGLKSAQTMLLDAADGDPLSRDDIEELLLPEDEDEFSTSYDEALAQLSVHRAVYGAMQSRLNRALDFVDVYHENIAAARSKIADTDYAREVARMANNRIMMQATSGLLAQNNANNSLTLGLLSSL